MIFILMYNNVILIAAVHKYFIIISMPTIS